MAVHGRNYFTIRSTDLAVPSDDTRGSTNRQIQLLVTDPDGLQLELTFAP